MKVTAVNTAAIQGSFRWILVRLYTDPGLTGLGECYWGAGVQAGVHRLAPLLIGEDPHNVDPLFQKMVRGASGGGSSPSATSVACATRCTPADGPPSRRFQRTPR